MKRNAAEILKDALVLPTEARAALAGSLLESLDSEVDGDAEAAWATEVNGVSPSWIAERRGPSGGPKCAADSPRDDEGSDGF